MTGRPPDVRSGPPPGGEPPPNTDTSHRQAADVEPILTRHAAAVVLTRSWFAGRWFDPPRLGLSDLEREREIVRLVAELGWPLEEALAAVEPPAWWPADDPARDTSQVVGRP